MSAHSCADILNELYLYLDGELDAPGTTTIEDHLRHCRACLEAFDFEAELKRVVAIRARTSCSAEFIAVLRVMLVEVQP